MVPPHWGAWYRLTGASRTNPVPSYVLNVPSYVVGMVWAVWFRSWKFHVPLHPGALHQVIWAAACSSTSLQQSV